MSNPHIDGTSWTICLITAIGGYAQVITKSDVLFFLTVLSALTSLVYNIIKTCQQIRKGKQ